MNADHRRIFWSRIVRMGMMFVLACLIGTVAYNAFAAPKKSPPNFVFILLDDAGQRDFGCYGGRFYETPNIDRLATEGMRFTDAYAACPVCSPTRYSIQTGRYPVRSGLTDFLLGTKKGKVLPPACTPGMPVDEVTIAEALKAAGYKSGYIGKWHLGAIPPGQQGYDMDLAVPARIRFSPYNVKVLPDGPQGEYMTDRLTDEAIRFIDANKQGPFLLCLAELAPHVPIASKENYIRKYKEKLAVLPPASGPEFLPEHDLQARQIQNDPVYAGMIQSADDSVGRIMEHLKKLGIAENTVIIFMSDNGGLSTAEGSPTSNVPWRGGKGWLYEGGIREPMIIKWPGVTHAGSTCSAPVTSTDFFPTLLEMAGLTLQPKLHQDGQSLVPLLQSGGSPARQAIYWHYPHYSNQGGPPSGAVRAGDWKLIEFYEDMSVELYNLSQDPSEKHNLALENPAKVAELRDMLHLWREETGAKMPSPNPGYTGKKEASDTKGD